MEGPNYNRFQHQVKGWRASEATDIEKDQISVIQQGVVCFTAKCSEWKPMTGPMTTRKSMTYDKMKTRANALRVVTKKYH